MIIGHTAAASAAAFLLLEKCVRVSERAPTKKWKEKEEAYFAAAAHIAQERGRERAVFVA